MMEEARGDGSGDEEEEEEEETDPGQEPNYTREETAI
jgi:hypothetical protein